MAPSKGQYLLPRRTKNSRFGITRPILAPKETLSPTITGSGNANLANAQNQDSGRSQNWSPQNRQSQIWTADVVPLYIVDTREMESFKATLIVTSHVGLQA